MPLRLLAIGQQAGGWDAASAHKVCAARTDGGRGVRVGGAARDARRARCNTFTRVCVMEVPGTFLGGASAASCGEL